MLKNLLNETQIKILEFLIDKEKSLTTISNHLHLSKPGASKQIKTLIRLGMISERKEKTKKGTESKYSLKRCANVCIIEPSNQGIIDIKINDVFSPKMLLLEQIKNDEFKKDLRKFLNKISKLPKKKKPMYIIIFGSVARDEGTWKSDIDVTILNCSWNKKEKEKINKIIADITPKIKHQIKPQYQTLLEIETTEPSDLIKEIWDSGMIIYGDIYGRSSLWKKMKKYKSIMN